ncbi:MAG TPA: hypothetical protein VHT26_24320 [Trebonia sp.]|jgi:hypothetical protein|nr:hypothetical protein [Trebonia sp.]
MVPEGLHDFFLGSAGVAGALTGLLFVAISVSGERLAKAEASSLALRIRANAALTGFINALVVSLFALIPDGGIGTTSLVVAIVGLLFVAAALLSLIRVRRLRWATGRDALLLVGQAVVFVLQLIFGIQLMGRPSDSGAANGVAILVVVCFVIGISRAWELIGGPSIGITHEVVALVRSEEQARASRAAAAAGQGTEPEDGREV